MDHGYWCCYEFIDLANNIGEMIFLRLDWTDDGEEEDDDDWRWYRRRGWYILIRIASPWSSYKNMEDAWHE